MVQTFETTKDYLVKLAAKKNERFNAELLKHKQRTIESVKIIDSEARSEQTRYKIAISINLENPGSFKSVVKMVTDHFLAVLVSERSYKEEFTIPPTLQTMKKYTDHDMVKIKEKIAAHNQQAKAYEK